MSTIRLHQTTTSTPEQYVAGLTDLGPCRLVYGVASLPLGAPVELEVIFELAG